MADVGEWIGTAIGKQSEAVHAETVVMQFNTVLSMGKSEQRSSFVIRLRYEHRGVYSMITIITTLIDK